jgi:hypothetical protein
MNILKKMEIVSGRSFWDQEKLFEEETGVEKSHSTVP